MTAQIKCYDRVGNSLEVLDKAQLGTRSWVLNRIGDFDFRIPRNDDKATETNLGKLNLITVQSDIDIPDWGGRVAQLDWSDEKWLYVRCESKESLLRRHLIVHSVSYGQLTAGHMALLLIDSELRKPGGIPGIAIGDIDTVGGAWVDTFTAPGWDLWDRCIPELLKTTEQESGEEEETWVDADGSFNWKIQRGTDKSASVVLRSGYHIVKWGSYKIDYSRFITQAWGFGNATAWDSKAKELQRLTDGYDEWGVLEGYTFCTSNTSSNTAKYARQAVRKNPEPQRTLDFIIMNRNDIWEDFWVGDTVRVVIPNLGWQSSGGFDENMKITGIEVQEEPGLMRITGRLPKTYSLEQANFVSVSE